MSVLQAQDPTLERSFRGHKDVVTGLAFKPSMSQLASSSLDHSVMIWNFKPQLRAFRFVGHKGPVTGLDFSSSGNLLASSSRDKTVRLWTPNIWSTHRTKFQYTLAGHLNWVRTAKFSPDSKVVVSGSDDKTVKLWDLTSKTCVKTYWDHLGIVSSVAFHPSGTIIATASTDRSIKLFDIRTHKLIQHYGDAHNAAQIAGQSLEGVSLNAGGVNSICFGGDNGEWLISTGMDGVVKVWDVKEGHLFYTLHGHKGGATTAGVFSAKSDFFATGGSDSQVMVWKSNFDSIVKKRPEAPRAAKRDISEVPAIYTELAQRHQHVTMPVTQPAVLSSGAHTAHVVQENSMDTVPIGTPFVIKKSIEELSEDGQEPNGETIRQSNFSEFNDTLNHLVRQIDVLTQTMSILESRLTLNEDRLIKVLSHIEKKNAPETKRFSPAKSDNIPVKNYQGDNIYQEEQEGVFAS